MAQHAETLGEYTHQLHRTPCTPQLHIRKLQSIGGKRKLRQRRIRPRWDGPYYISCINQKYDSGNRIFSMAAALHNCDIIELIDAARRPGSTIPEGLPNHIRKLLRRVSHHTPKYLRIIYDSSVINSEYYSQLAKSYSRAATWPHVS